jgi:hypothetical protein
MELHEALTQIASIKRQIARTEKFRGYRPWPVAVGGMAALGAAAVQGAVVAEPMQDLQGYLALWVTVAAVAGTLSVMDVWFKHRQDVSLSGTLARLACEQFLPCVVAGAMVTAVIACYTPQVAWMLPGLWTVIYSLGLFASFRLLPSAVFAVGVWYLGIGSLYLALGPERAGLAPWTMGLAFGVGQLASAAVLWRQDGNEVNFGK